MRPDFRLVPSDDGGGGQAEKCCCTSTVLTAFNRVRNPARLLAPYGRSVANVAQLTQDVRRRLQRPSHQHFEQSSFYFIKGGHSPAYSRFSPGKALTYAMLSRAFSVGLSTYEFLGADDPWKLRWTSSSRHRLIFHAFRPAPDGLLEWTVSNYGRRAARRAASLRPIAHLRQKR